MKIPVHTFRTASQRDVILNKIAALQIPRCGFDLTLKYHKVRRTSAQNSRLQWLCGLHAGWLNARRMELISQGLLPKYFPAVDTNAVRKQIFNPLYCGTDSSTKPSKMDMVDILTKYETDLRDLGIDIPLEQGATW